MDFEPSLTTPSTAMSFDSATAATSTAAASTTATTSITTVTTYTPSSEISTIASEDSTATLSSETPSHLSREFVSNRPVRSLQEAVEIAACELARQRQVNFMLGIYDIFGDITDAASAQVAWLSNFAERNSAWKQFKYMQYNDFLKALDSSSRVREIKKWHHTTQRRTTWDMTKLGDLWQHYPALQEFLSNSSGSEKRMGLTAIINETSTDPGLAKRCRNCVCINSLTKLNRKLIVNKWYTFREFQEA